MALLDALNDRQAHAARIIDGPLLVLAGAGTGKTRVITYRIAHMIQSGVPGSNILGMTFTNKAAREMKERLGQLIGTTVSRDVTLCTFHSFCARFLRKHITVLGFDTSFTICSESDKKGIMRQAAIDLGIFHEEFPLDRVMYLIDNAKNALEPEAELLGDYPKEMPWARAMMPRYQQLLKNQNMVDFDDLLLFTVKILSENESILADLRDKLRYILVDEYQDTNEVQFYMLELLAGDRANLCVVGDDDQSIYGWRGAQIKNILDFPRMFPGTEVIRLEQNYRSTGTILDAANAVIAKNASRYGKSLWTGGDKGAPLQLTRAENNENEAAYIAEMCWEAKARHFNWKDIAILYRSNHLSRALEDALRQQNVPYRVIGSKSFFQRKEILDAAAYLRLCINRRDNQSALRILGTPPRGLGDKAIESLKNMGKTTGKSIVELLIDPDYLNLLSSKARNEAERLGRTLYEYHQVFSQLQNNIGESVRSFLKEVDYLDGMLKIYKKFDEAQTRRENVEELINAVYRFENNAQANDTPVSLNDFLESFTLLDDNEEEEDDDGPEDAVQLMTVHAAKGLEFPIVFLVGAEQGIFPNQRALDDGSTEEERRLFYVAVTRAKERLFITHARTRFRFGDTMYCSPSAFLKDIPPELYCGNTTFTARWDAEPGTV